MKKIILLTLILQISIITANQNIFAQINFSFDSNSYQTKFCNNCRSQNQKDASFCSNCGKNFKKRKLPFYRCIRCYYPFKISPENSNTICNNCNTKNNLSSNFCSHCGIKIKIKKILTKCPSCQTEFEDFYPYKHKKTTTCTQCNNRFFSNYKKCPFCKYKNKKQKKHNNRDTHRIHKKRIKTFKPSKENSGPAFLDSFIKKSYAKTSKKINIGHLTAERLFSQVIVYIEKNEKHTPIINTIKIKDRGKYTSYPQSVRLKEGKNQLNIPFSRHSTELVISFNHGKNSKVKIYLE